MQPPWVTRTGSDPDETDDSYQPGWRWQNTANDKIWECVYTTGSNDAVWRCTNWVTETYSTNADLDIDNTSDGSIYWITSPAVALNINVPDGLNNGLTFKIVVAQPNLIMTFVGTGSNTINRRTGLTASTMGAVQYAQVTCHIIDNNDTFIEGDLA
jgi:hypothetical protein